MNDSANLTLVSIDKDGCIRVASTGNLTAANINLGPRNPLEPVLGASWSNNRVILDLAKTDFMDSTAIAWLISDNQTIFARPVDRSRSTRSPPACSPDARPAQDRKDHPHRGQYEPAARTVPQPESPRPRPP